VKPRFFKKLLTTDFLVVKRNPVFSKKRGFSQPTFLTIEEFISCTFLRKRDKNNGAGNAPQISAFFLNF
jgi:hypothetical protein